MMQTSVWSCCLLLLLLAIIDANNSYDQSTVENDALVLSPNDPSSVEGSNMTLWCTLSDESLKNYTADDLRMVAKVYHKHGVPAVPSTPIERQIVDSFKREKVNSTTVRLFSHSVSLDFDYHVIICHTTDWILHDMQLIQVGLPPPPIAITEHYVRNWSWFVFKWNIPNHLHFRTTYKAWYKIRLPEITTNNSGDGYVMCRTCESWWNKTVPCNMCKVRIANLSQPVTMNVSAVNLVGATSASLTLPNLYLYNIPGSPFVSHNSSKTMDVNGTYATTIFLRAPRRRFAVLYYTTILCDSWEYRMESHQWADADLTIQRAALPAYSQCQIAVRCRSVDDNGVLSKYFGDETVLRFRTDDGVPHRSVRICSNCFYIEKSDQSSTMKSVVVFFKGLSETDARGNVTKYEVKYWRENNKTDISTVFIDLPSYPQVELRLKADESYVVTIDASTIRGFNKTLVPKRIRIPKQSDVMDPVVNFTALEINSTHVLLSWSPSTNYSRHTVFWCYSGAYISSCQSEIRWVELNDSTSSHIVRRTLKGENGLVADRFGISQFHFELHRLFTSNIVWTNCIFSLNHVSEPPHVRVVHVGDPVVLELTTDLCPLEKSGFVYAYHIIASELNDSNSTGRDRFRRTVMVSDLDENCHREAGPSHANERVGCYSITDLKASTQYMVSVFSVTAAGISSKNTTSHFTTESVPLAKSNALIIVLVISGVVVLLLTVLGLHTWIRCCRRASCFDVPIKTPNIGTITAKNYYTYSPPLGTEALSSILKPDSKPSKLAGILPKLDSKTIDYSEKLDDQSGLSLYTKYDDRYKQNSADGLWSNDGIYAMAAPPTCGPAFIESSSYGPRSLYYDSGGTADAAADVSCNFT